MFLKVSYCKTHHIFSFKIYQIQTFFYLHFFEKTSICCSKKELTMITTRRRLKFTIGLFYVQSRRIRGMKTVHTVRVYAYYAHTVADDEDYAVWNVMRKRPFSHKSFKIATAKCDFASEDDTSRRTGQFYISRSACKREVSDLGGGEWTRAEAQQITILRVVDCSI